MPDQNFRTLLNDIARALDDERSLLGDDLIAGPPRPSVVARADGASGPTGVQAMTPARPQPLASQKESTLQESLFDTPPVPITTEAWGQATTLADLDRHICTCLKCPLGNTRTKFVFGVGNPNATLMLIGEAPGADEDAQGEPFVGKAGQLLNKILAAINFRREDVYICNILKCRPPGNRTPAPEEVEQCLPYLKKQVELVKPRIILCLGLTAAQNILGISESLSRLRGRVMSYEGIPLMVTYHPAALLRNPNWKQAAWEDVQATRKLHDELVAQSTQGA